MQQQESCGWFQIWMDPVTRWNSHGGQKKSYCLCMLNYFVTWKAGIVNWRSWSQKNMVTYSACVSKLTIFEYNYREKYFTWNSLMENAFEILCLKNADWLLTPLWVWCWSVSSEQTMTFCCILSFHVWKITACVGRMRRRCPWIKQQKLAYITVNNFQSKILSKVFNSNCEIKHTHPLSALIWCIKILNTTNSRLNQSCQNLDYYASSIFSKASIWSM